MATREKIFDQGKEFWNNYLKGRPRAPESLFDRIFNYHEAHGGLFGTVHDVGAGNAPYAQKLRSRFSRVIVSDITARNVELARERLGDDGFSYRAAKIEEVDDLEPGSIDLVFATNAMHFPDQRDAMNAVIKQLKSGGTFLCAAFGPARFEDENLQDLWKRISYKAGRIILEKSENPEKLIGIMARTQDFYNVAPLDPKFFLPGAKRIHLNMKKGGIVGFLPPDLPYKSTEPLYTGPDDAESFEDEDGWSFKTDLAGVKDHMCSFPPISDHISSFDDEFKQLERLIGEDTVVRGYWPAKVILATRR
ncbi:S-adenosyl-L-methionine-dependent methyltransferase [Xylariaceae sp. FL0255]|nr:S-adenosyl-L-methionine-dependent methyltransferase [Xylariaceae sp. FL0255]